MSTIVQVVTEHLIKNRSRKLAWRPTPADVRLYALTFGPGCLLLAAVWLQTRVPIPYLMKDPLAVVQLSKDCCRFYFGLVSNLGILVWAAAAAVCLFASVALLSFYRRGGEFRFLAVAGFFTAWLVLDDLFLIHEDVLPLFGVPQLLTYAVYAGIAVLYLLLSWRWIIGSRPVLMAIALTLLGSSVMIDVLVHTESSAHVFAEDGAKFIGILAWSAFHIAAALDILAVAVNAPRFIFVPRSAA